MYTVFKNSYVHVLILIYHVMSYDHGFLYSNYALESKWFFFALLVWSKLIMRFLLVSRKEQNWLLD